MSTKRIAWVDVAKGIGALLVIWGHFIPIEKVQICIYAFHMPLFFFLAGVTFMSQEKQGFATYFKKKFRTIIIPYFIFSIPVYFVNIAVALKNKEDIIMSALNKTAGIFLCWKTEPLYNGVWFLPCIFATYILAWGVCKLCKNKIGALGVSCVVALIGLVLVLNHISLPWGLDTSCVTLPFFFFGYVMKEQMNRVTAKWSFMYLPMIAIAYLNYRQTGFRVEIYANNYGNIFLFYIAAMMGIIATVGFTQNKRMMENELIKELGRCSLYLYGAQLPLFSVSLFVFNMFNIYSMNMFWGGLIGVVTSCLVLLMLLQVKPLYNMMYCKLCGK